MSQLELSPYVELLEHTRALTPVGLSRRRLEAATDLLDHAQQLVVGDALRLRTRLERMIARFDGIPTWPNPWAILGMTRDETRFTQVLRWLLDPAENHGLGDAVLSRFLTLLGSQHARFLAREPPTRGWTVRAEVSFIHGIPDLVLLSDELIVVAEVKVDDEVHTVPYDGKRIPQTAAYRLDLESGALHPRLRLEHRTLRSDARTAYAFIAPADCSGPEDEAYAAIHLGHLLDVVLDELRWQQLTDGQRWALRGMVTLMLDFVRRDTSGTELLTESRRVLHELGRTAPAATTLRARWISEAWTRLKIRESDR